MKSSDITAAIDRYINAMGSLRDAEQFGFTSEEEQEQEALANVGSYDSNGATMLSFSSANFGDVYLNLDRLGAYLKKELNLPE